MSKTLTRRCFVSSGVSACALALAGCVSSSPNNSTPALRSGDPARALITSEPDLYDPEFATKYGARPSEQFPIPAVASNQLPPKFRRQRVNYKSTEPIGSVIVDTNSFYLYLVEDEETAMRYGVGLGRAGFAWSGRAHIAWKQAWPKWTPPDEMIEREPELEQWSMRNGGMPPGLTNPLGARALYIHQGNVDTLYRLHGTPQPETIGKAVSSGCVRLVNQDVIDLYDRITPRIPIFVT